MGSIGAWFAMQFGKPLVKWGAIGLVVVIAFGSYTRFIWNKAQSNVYQEWDAANAKQAAESVRQIAAAYQSRDQVMRERESERADLTTRISDLDRKVALYERTAVLTASCPAPAGSTDIFDDVRRVLDTASVSLPTADASSGGPHEPSQAHIETTRILLGYVRALGDLAEQTASLTIDYEGLVQERRGQYIVEQARYNGQE